MFIQTIEGKTNDPDALHRQLELWQEELQPGAIGYLGSTGGVTAGGDCILIARFQSADAARQNSERPEQSAWWAQTRTCFDGPVRFHDTTDVQVMRHGDPNTATFVQVMEGHVTDRHRAHELAEESDETLTKARPDLIEAITAYFDNDEFTEIAYFTNQQDARANEGRDIPSDMAPMFAEWESVMKVERYLDVNDPWLVST